VPRPKQRTQDLRDRVLDVAVSLLADEGVAGFTTREVARQAQTSTPAVYELFGDKAGLVREVFFEGFRLLRWTLGELAETSDPRADLVAVLATFRGFTCRHPVLAEVMFSRPFADFDPGPEELAAGAAVREFCVARVQRCVAAGVLAGDPADIAHVVVALAQGMARKEAAGWLGRSRASVDRRWEMAVRAVLDGLSPAVTDAVRDRARDRVRGPERDPGPGRHPAPPGPARDLAPAGGAGSPAPRPPG
jgi:AcrR family transcriptional regulator